MLVLGIDPGTASTGYGLVRSSGSRLHALEQGVIATAPASRWSAGWPTSTRASGELLDRHAP